MRLLIAMMALCTVPLQNAIAAGEGTPVFPLRAGPEGRSLVDAGGKPFFYHADTAWVLPKKATLAVAQEYFDQRVKDGFTAIHLHAVSKEVGPVRNVSGDEPFVPLDNILKPNEPYWRHLDAILEAAEQRGLLIGLSALWIRWGGDDKEGWRYQLTEENARPYGRFLGKRYAARKNILWILGGDANPGEKQKAVSLLAQGLQETAPHHLITVHNAPENASATFFGQEPWLDLNAAYTYQEVHPAVLVEWNRPGTTRPIFLIESGYEKESNDGRGGAPFRVRRQVYGAILSGALAGHAYGHRELWRFSEKWREAANDPGYRHMRHVKELFGTRAWWKLTPDESNALVLDGRGRPGEVDRVAAARATDGSFAIVYLPIARTISVDLGRLNGPAKAHWIDPTTGERMPIEGLPFPGEGRRDFSPPDKNAAGDSDWVLLLESADGEGRTTGGSVLDIEGTRFTLNGKPTFLLGISYYAGLGAPRDFVQRDLDDLQRYGFNWLRVWATWNSFDNDVSAVDAQGRPREPFLGRLQWLVAECDRRGLVVDVTFTRDKGGLLPDYAAHLHAVETLVNALKPYRNWYLDLANERDVQDARYVSPEELRQLRDRVHQLDPRRLVTASGGGHESSAGDLRDALLTAGVDFFSPHRPRTAESPGRTEAKTRACLALMKEIGRVAPVHYQEPFRRGYDQWEPLAADFLTDLHGAVAGGAAGWCFHNGTQQNAPDQQPRRSFDLRSQRLFDQLDAEEKKVVAEASANIHPDRGQETTK